MADETKTDEIKTDETKTDEVKVAEPVTGEPAKKPAKAKSDAPPISERTRAEMEAGAALVGAKKSARKG